MTKITWLIIAIIAILGMLVFGLLPLPGQKHNVTPHSEPSPPGQSPQPATPTGPPEKQSRPGDTPR